MTAGTYPTIAPHGGTAMAKFNSFDQSGGATRLWTNALDLSGYAAPAVVFWMSHDTGYSGNADRLQVQVSLDGTTWVDAGAPVLRYDAAYTTPGWGEHAVVLPAGYNVNGVYVGFLGISAYGNNFFLDDTALAEGWYPCPYLTLAPDAARTGCPGSTVDYALTLTNMTPDGDTFDVTVTGNAWPTTASPTQLALGPGASGVVTVDVDLPSAPGSDTAVVTALGQTNGGTDTATLATTGVDHLLGVDRQRAGQRPHGQRLRRLGRPGVVDHRLRRQPQRAQLRPGHRHLDGGRHPADLHRQLRPLGLPGRQQGVHVRRHVDRRLHRAVVLRHGHHHLGAGNAERHGARPDRHLGARLGLTTPRPATAT